MLGCYNFIGFVRHLDSQIVRQADIIIFAQRTAGRRFLVRLQAFRQYRSIARSPEAVGKLYALWKDQKAPAGCSLSENDYSSLSYDLAIQMPDKADEIVATQQARITNPDRKRQRGKKISPVRCTSCKASSAGRI